MTRAFSIMAITALILAMALTTLSAYIRLSKAGLDCPDWPVCYGRIGAKAEQIGNKGVDPYRRLLEEAQQPLSWASSAHRAIAAATGLLVALMAGMSLLRRRASGPSVLIPLALVGLTAFLAWLGIWSKGLHSPAVVMGNLIGGVTMAVLLWWLILSMERSSPPGPSAEGGRVMRGAVLLGFLLVVLQIVLGGLTSAEYAALSCPTFPDCGGAMVAVVEGPGAVGYLPRASSGCRRQGGSERVRAEPPSSSLSDLRLSE